MLRSLATVGGFTLMSRVLGMVREIFMASFLGTSIVTDAFYTALRLPNMFRRIFGEGAFNSAFVPLFNRELVENSHEEAERFASNAFSWLAVVLTIGTLIIVPGMPWFARILAPAADPETYSLIVAYARIMFSYLLCMALSAHLSGVLNSLRVFSTPAFAPVLLNILMLLVLGIIVPLAHWQGELETIGTAVSWSVFVAGFAQLLLLWIACWKKGMRIRLIRPFKSQRIHRLMMLMGPGIAAAGVQQINLVVGTMIATSEKSAVGSLSFAERLFQLPNGMIGAAFGVVLLPEITRRLRKGDESGAEHQIGQGIIFSMLLTIPAAIAFTVVPDDFVRAIYQRGEFTAASTAAVAPALAAFALGIPAYVLVKVLQAGYFARENTKSPMKIAAVTMLTNVVASLVLFRLMGFVGIALATSIAGWVNVLLLILGQRGMLGLTRHRVTQLARISVASLGMGLALWFISEALHPWLAGSEWQRIISLALLIGAGGSLYALLALGLKATSLSELKSGFKR